MAFQCEPTFNALPENCLWESSVRRILESNRFAFKAETSCIYECAKDLRFDNFLNLFLNIRVYFNPATEVWEFLKVTCQGCGRIVTVDHTGQIVTF